MDSRSNILKDRYILLKLLGEGGMGKVYLCKDKNTNMQYAIKEFKNIHSEDMVPEYEILQVLDHKGIPKIIDIFEENQYTYMVEEYIEGQTLEEYISAKVSLTKQEICDIAIEISNIISYLHSFNPPIIYRDLKPSNIIISSKGNIIIVDFGSCRTYKEENDSDTVFLGSKGYAAPEQCGRGQSSVQTDVYGLGALMYYIVNKKPPLGFIECIDKNNYNKCYGLDLINIIIKAMQLDINSRFKSMEEMKRSILKVKNIKEDNTVILGRAKARHNEGKQKQTNKSLTKSKKLLISVASIVLLAAVVGILLLSEKAQTAETIQDKPVDKVTDSDKTIDKPQAANKSETVNTTESINTQQTPTKIEEEQESEDDDKKNKVKGKAKGKGKYKED